MGLRPKDIIKKFGAIEVPHMGALLYWLDKKKIGDPFILMVERNGKIELLRGKIQPKPYEAGKSVFYDEFKWEDGGIRTIVNRPAIKDKVPAVLFIQDYTCGSIDYAGRSYEIIPRMAAQFAEAGMAFIRVEKPGVGDSQTGESCHQIGFKQEGKMYKQAMKYVRNLDFVDVDKIVVLAQGYGGNQVI
jgi:hypothetical protein